jgi:hypothetical protein
MNGKTAKLLRKYSGLGQRARYQENKRRWNATPRTLRSALRAGAEDKLNAS